MTARTSHRATLGGHGTPPVLLVLGSMLSLQFGAAIATKLFDEVGAAGASALRLGLAAVVLVLWARPAVRSWSSDHRRSVVLLGLSMAAMNAAFKTLGDPADLAANIHRLQQGIGQLATGSRALATGVHALRIEVRLDDAVFVAVHRAVVVLIRHGDIRVVHAARRGRAGSGLPLVHGSRRVCARPSLHDAARDSARYRPLGERRLSCPRAPRSKTRRGSPYSRLRKRTSDRLYAATEAQRLS